MLDWHHDPVNGRLWAMWQEGGLKFRANIVQRVGDQIPLHDHSYDHVAFVQGHFRCTVIPPDGEQRTVELASADMGLDLPSRIVIEARNRHRFILLARGPVPGQVLCVAPADRGW